MRNIQKHYRIFLLFSYKTCELVRSVNNPISCSAITFSQHSSTFITENDCWEIGFHILIWPLYTLFTERHLHTCTNVFSYVHNTNVVENVLAGGQSTLLAYYLWTFSQIIFSGNYKKNKNIFPDFDLFLIFRHGK